MIKLKQTAKNIGVKLKLTDTTMTLEKEHKGEMFSCCIRFKKDTPLDTLKIAFNRAIKQLNKQIAGD